MLDLLSRSFENRFEKLTAIVVAATVGLMCCGAANAQSGNPSSNDIVNMLKLKPKPPAEQPTAPGAPAMRTRGLKLGGAAPQATPQPPADPKKEAQVAAIKSMIRTRGLNLSPDKPLPERQEEQVNQPLQEARAAIAEVTKESPHTDLEVYFVRGSADLTPQAIATLNTLGVALRDPELRGNTFFISGHTDTVGSPDQNLELSRRRAQTVNDYLVRTFKLDPKNLIPLGYGYERLKDSAHGEADVNRRVQVTNVGEMASQ